MSIRIIQASNLVGLRIENMVIRCWLVGMTVELQLNFGSFIRTVIFAIAFGLGVNGHAQGGNSLFFGKKTDLNPTTTTTSGGSGHQGMVSSADVEIKPNDPADLKVSKEKYRERVKDLTQPLSDLLAKYEEQLVKMRDVFQKADDSENTLEAKKEIIAIEATGKVADKYVETSKVAAYRKIYDAENARIEVVVLNKIGQLNVAYKASLDEMKTAYLKADRLDDAIIVMEVVKSIPDMPEILPVVFAKPEPVVNPPGSIRIRVQVEGMSVVCISGDKIWFDHSGGSGSAPGLHKGEFATRLNGEDWTPEWEGKVSRKFDAEVGLPAAGIVEMSCNHKKGRGHAKVLEQPSLENDYTAKVGLYDVGKKGKKFSSAQFIDFELSW